MDITIKTSGGRKLDEFIVSLENAAKITKGDLFLAGQLIRSDIRERTARGVDVNGSAFKPYSSKGPFYYNPNSKGQRSFGFGTEGAVKRLRSFLNRGLTKMQKQMGQGVQTSRTGQSIKFDSYAAFKSAFGRANVDLQGVTPPHMLDAIVVRVDGSGSSQSDTSAGSQVTVGIYEQRAAEIASGHNYGNRTLPVRKFFGISRWAVDNIKNMLQQRIADRVRRLR